jgi:hypothetical protein
MTKIPCHSLEVNTDLSYKVVNIPVKTI